MDGSLRARLAEVRGRVAFGLLPLAVAGRPPDKQAVDLIRSAVDGGVRLLDTADIYGLDDEFGYTESLLARATKAIPDSDRPIITTKGGLVRLPDGSRRPNGRSEYLRTACHNSLRRLELETIDIYQLHRPDPEVPFADSVGALRDLLDEGAIRAVGVSNVTAEQLDVAGSVLGEDLLIVENKFSVEESGDTAVIAQCAHRGWTYLAWGPLGGVGRGARLGERVPALVRVAERYGVSPHRVAIAWILAQQPDIAPVVGASSRDHLLDAIAAIDLRLTTEDLADIAPG